MAKVMITESYLEDIADAIREKKGVLTTYYPSQMAEAISTIDGGGTPVINSLNVTPSTSQQTFDSSSVDGYKPVTVAAMPSMTLPTSSAASATTGYASKATISRSTSDQYINIPTGYNAAGAYYKVNAVANGSVTAPSSISGTNATVSTGTNTLTLTKSVSVTPKVTTAGYISSGTAGNSSVSLTGSVTTKAAATITPSTSNQTIASGTYLTGTQTISGDANLIAENIKKDVTIFGTTGTYEGSGGGGGGDSKFVTGTFTTSSSTSTNGTINVPYTGSGYPIMLVIIVEGGIYNSNITPWYSSVTRYAVGQITIGKSITTSTPNYGTSGSQNYGSVELIYKNSTSSSTTYSSTRSVTANSYSSSNANGTSTTCVRWKGNKVISYRTGGGSSSSYGLLTDTTYRYYVYYSSQKIKEVKINGSYW